MRKVLKTLMVLVLVVSLSSCAFLDSLVSEIRGDLIGNSFNIETYDNYGELTMTTSGKKINLKGNRVREAVVTDTGYGYSYTMSSVVTITIDGKEIESCGDTLIFAETGLEKEMDFTTPEFINSTTDGSLGDNTYLAYSINQYKNLFGKSRILLNQIPDGSTIMRLLWKRSILGNS